ncbi:MAG: LacI family DNA-binding transcriptional regulator [Galbitalea sp.]
MTREDAETRDPDRATLALVANDAAVSVSTVSKVLNGRKGVSIETRSRVEALLRNRGYNRRGTSLAAELIEVVFSELDSSWAIEIIRGVERVAREENMSLVLTQSGDRHSPSPDWIEGVIRRRPVAVVLIFSDLSTEHKRQLRTRNIPFVVVDPAGNPPRTCPLWARRTGRAGFWPPSTSSTSGTRTSP